MLVFLIAKPRLVDPRSTITIEGIDIMIVLDVSGSMSLPHCDGDNRSRLEVAKKEAIRFIQNRPNDAIGLVVFGNDALSRCPLTIDKMVLKHAIDEIEIGSLVSAEGTLLARAILTAANRLKQSQATSKIMIVLTDGEPSPNDSDPQTAIMAAQQLGIKIYTVGIGDNQQIMVSHPIFGIATPFATTLNKELLTKIADQTGGKFFEAKNQNDMRHVYDTIDTLEKKKIEAPIFSNYVEWFMPLLWLCLALLSIEFLAKATLLQGVGI
jgi:Ca-activated chloride channel family protein